MYDASDCEHRNKDDIASVWTKIAQEMGLGKWRTMVFFVYFDDGNKNNNDNVVIAIRPYISSSCRPSLFLEQEIATT